VDERVVEQRPRRERAARCALAAEGHVELLRLDHGERLGRIGTAQDDGMTFLADCPRCGRRELRGIRGAHVQHTGAGDLVSLACRRCGATVTAGTNGVLPESLHGVA
jgi:hypothetical protein